MNDGFIHVPGQLRKWERLCLCVCLNGAPALFVAPDAAAPVVAALEARQNGENAEQQEEVPEKAEGRSEEKEGPKEDETPAPDGSSAENESPEAAVKEEPPRWRTSLRANRSPWSRPGRSSRRQPGRGRKGPGRDKNRRNPAGTGRRIGQYLQGGIFGNEMLERIDRKVRMKRMEGK